VLVARNGRAAAELVHGEKLWRARGQIREAQSRASLSTPEERPRYRWWRAQQPKRRFPDDDYLLSFLTPDGGGIGFQRGFKLDTRESRAPYICGTSGPSGWASSGSGVLAPELRAGCWSWEGRCTVLADGWGPPVSVRGEAGQRACEWRGGPACRRHPSALGHADANPNGSKWAEAGPVNCFSFFFSSLFYFLLFSFCFQI
jgi:hypothetical protein